MRGFLKTHDPPRCTLNRKIEQQMKSSVLREVCSAGDINKLKDILDSDPTPSLDELHWALVFAAEGNHASIVGILMDHGAQVTNLSFSKALGNRSTTVFKEFVDHGWNINSTEFEDTALRLVTDNEQCTRWFLEHGADPNKQSVRNATPLKTAALHPNLSILDLLISHGAQPDPEALCSAITPRGRGGIPVLRFLISHGIDVNATLRQHGSPLHYAVKCGNREAVKVLLEAGADTSKTSNGRTAAEKARKEGEMEIYELLMAPAPSGLC